MTRSSVHHSILRAREEGFLRVRAYHAGSRLHAAWWKECQAADRVYMLLVEKRSCSRLIVDTYTCTGIVDLSDAVVRDITSWATTQYGRRWPRSCILGSSAVDLDQLHPEDAEAYAGDLARTLRWSSNALEKS